MKFINFFQKNSQFAILAIISLVMACNTGSNTGSNSPERTPSGGNTETSPVAETTSQRPAKKLGKFDTCAGYTDMAECIQAQFDTKGNAISGCAVSAFDSNRCVDVAFRNTPLTGCNQFSSPEHIGKCESTTTHTDIDGNSFSCKVALHYPNICMNASEYTAAEQCGTINMITNPTSCGSGIPLWDGTKVDGTLDCVKNDYADLCVTPENQAAVPHGCGDVDLTKKDRSKCKLDMNILSGGKIDCKPAIYANLCVEAALSDLPTQCKDMTADDRLCTMSTPKLGGDTLDCGKNEYTTVCSEAAKIKEVPECQYINVMEKCHEAVSKISQTTYVCRINPADKNKCEVAPSYSSAFTYKHECKVDDANEYNSIYFALKRVCDTAAQNENACNKLKVGNARLCDYSSGCKPRDDYKPSGHQSRVLDIFSPACMSSLEGEYFQEQGKNKLVYSMSKNSCYQKSIPVDGTLLKLTNFCDVKMQGSAW